MRVLMGLLCVFVLGVLAPSAWASPTYQCRGERIEKGSSTWGFARSTGSDFRIEKGSSTIGWAKKRSSKFALESAGGSTIGWLAGSRIEKPNGATWVQLSEAIQLVKGCPDAVAAALWVLNQQGKL